MRSFALLCIAQLALACGGSDHGTGTLSLAITDAPFPATEGCLDAALITIDGVRARTDDGFTEIGLVDPEPDGTVTLDLLQLRAGLMDDLALGELPTGEVSEVRLHVVESVLVFIDDSPDRDFKVPSGAASGLKIKVDPPALVVEDQTTELIFDVDLANSFHTTGLGGDPTCEELAMGAGGVIFSPVVRVNNVATDGIVLGDVTHDGGEPAADVEVCAYEADTDIVLEPEPEPEPEPVATTFSAPDDLEGVSEGDYALLLPAGSYDFYVRVQAEDDKALALEDVLVTAGEQLEGQDLSLP